MTTQGQPTLTQAKNPFPCSSPGYGGCRQAGQAQVGVTKVKLAGRPCASHIDIGVGIYGVLYLHIHAIATYGGTY